MKAPDKVFFPNDINLLTKLSLAIKQKGDVCYIRKDALLEYLTERRKGLSSGDSFVAGERKMLKEIIEKIESL